jgi:hypothetical protein
VGRIAFHVVECVQADGIAQACLKTATSELGDQNLVFKSVDLECGLIVANRKQFSCDFRNQELASIHGKEPVC